MASPHFGVDHHGMTFECDEGDTKDLTSPGSSLDATPFMQQAQDQLPPWLPAARGRDASRKAQKCTLSVQRPIRPWESGCQTRPRELLQFVPRAGSPGPAWRSEQRREQDE